MKIVGYIRVSTDQQVESGLGLDAQANAIADYAKKHCVESYEIYRDEGLSGALALDKRPGILEAIGVLTKGAVLVVAKRDRLGRDPMVLAMIERAVQRKSARIVSVAGEGTDNDDPSSILMRRMVDAFGEYERLIIGARTKAALRTKKEKNERVGYIPFGLKLSDDGIKLEEHEEEQKILRKMKSLRKKGLSIRDIVKKMNEKRILRRQNIWNHASVHRALIKLA